MKNFRELQEALNRPYKYRIAAPTPKQWRARFKTDEGVEYIFRARKNPTGGWWSIVFWADQEHLKDTGMEFGMTGKEGTKAVRVLATVKELFEKFVKEVKPDEMFFTGDKTEGSGRSARTRLYTRFAKQFAKKFGYKLSAKDGGDEIEYDFKRIQKGVNYV